MGKKLSIILVEDNDHLRDLISNLLRADGHRVIALSCAEELEDFAGGEQADLFLIDLNLPGEDGFSLVRRIRQSQPLAGIVIISSRAELSDKTAGYNCGADWYFVKPVPFAELSAAISSFALRKQDQQLLLTPISGALQLNQLVMRGALGSVDLTSSEAELITAFARAPGFRLEYWQIAMLLKMPAEKKSRLEVRIFRLRKKLIAAGALDNVIESIRSVGYRLNQPILIFE